MATRDHYDIIVIGSGPGGGSVAHEAAARGKRVLLLERGGYLRRSLDNWNAKAVFVDAKYQAKETWYDAAGRAFHPGLHYFVGGNSKVYGAALLRLRERDFEDIVYPDGLSPSWPLSYSTFEPYYMRAEHLFHVHGARGEDPNEPPASGPYPFPPVAHEPEIATLDQDLRRAGVQPFHLPLGVLLDENNGVVSPTSPCIRCEAFDGFPCPTNGKADAQVMCVDPALAAHADHLTLLTGAYVSRLETDASGHTITGVCVSREGRDERYSADIVVVACGALSSALLFLRSANTAHPHGLANGSGQVGRNYMRHNQSVFMALLRHPNRAVFQKTLAISDFYLGGRGRDYPLGLIQLLAKTHPAQIQGETLPDWLDWLPSAPFEALADRSLGFWLSSEDLPRPDNRIYYDGERTVLHLTENNMAAHNGLREELKHLLAFADIHPLLMERRFYLGKDIPIAGTAHQAGTLRFGTDPASSVLDTDCKTHEIDNLYVADASFFPSIGAVNPTLTIIANALRVTDRILARLG
ncbi:GMC family oxidoreductase [Acidiferrobacter sp.]|uniref:GMC oxidoreductase n=1 Tax=Acidiferrobacter sp. TaxID=1872107 RepID=UPI0026192672|nr:GMC family oxidoreductase [Acidiferrobacter sp.]